MTKKRNLYRTKNSRSNFWLKSVTGSISMRVSESGGGLGEIFSRSGGVMYNNDFRMGTSVSRSGGYITKFIKGKWTLGPRFYSVSGEN